MYVSMAGAVSLVRCEAASYSRPVTYTVPVGAVGRVAALKLAGFASASV